MVHTFNAVEYLDYVRRSGRLLGIVTGTALAVTLIGSLLVPKEYTAMASIVIEPPGGSDPRAATAISPIYLESLKTYEQFASSDTLFARACEKFGLLESHGSPYIETFKQKVLRVTKLKETKILQISVTLRDRKQAQALVQFLAEETVNSSRRLSRQGDQEGIEEAKKRLEGTRAAVQRAREEAIAAAAGNAEASLTSEIENLAKLASTLRARLALARADAAEAAGRDAAMAKAQQARADSLVAEEVALGRELAAKSAALAKATAQREQIDTDMRMAQTAFDVVSRSVQELSASSGLRGEQLRVVDPGIVPQRPSFPNIPLNCAAALLIAGMAALVWLGLRFGIERQRTFAARAAFGVARGGSR